MSAHKCGVRIYAGGYIGHWCGKTAKFERDEKWYCGIHDPVASKAKSDKRNEEFREKLRREGLVNVAKAKAQAETLRRAGCFDDLLDALRFLLDREWRDDEGHPKLTEARNQAAAAIAKATGGAA